MKFKKLLNFLKFKKNKENSPLSSNPASRLKNNANKYHFEDLSQFVVIANTTENQNRKKANSNSLENDRIPRKQHQSKSVQIETSDPMFG